MLAFLEVFPVFARAKTEEGGLGLDSSDVGLLQSVTGLAGVIVVVAGLFPMLAKIYTVPGVFARTLVWSGTISYLLPPILAAVSTSTPWIGLILANLCVAISNQLLFGAALC